MKLNRPSTIRRRFAAALLPPMLVLVALVPLAFAQPASGLHRFSAITAPAPGTLLLSLGGSPPAPFQKLHDLFPVEVSADLVRWQPLAMVVRTNVTNEITFGDAGATEAPARFYRTPTNHFSTPFQAPTGPHAVGTFSRVLTDATRTNRYGLRGSSNFVVTFWYPAGRTAGAVPAAYMDRPLAERRAYWGPLTNQVPSLVQMAAVEAPLAAAPAAFPVVIYTHGLGTEQGRGARTENTEKMQELASHGYVVLAVDHTDAYGLVLPPDQLVVGARAFSFDFLNDRLKDIQLLLDLLARLNVDDALVRGRLDLDKIGIMGWSFGGGTAADACRSKDRLKAAVLLDAYLGSMPELMSKGLAKPFLTMNSPSSGLASDNTALFNKSLKDAYQLLIKDASHEMFTDNSWIVNPSAASRRRALAMNGCMVAFFDKHLKNLDNGLLDNPVPAYAEVLSFRKK